MKLGDLSVTYVEVLGRTLNALGGDSAALFADYGISAETLSSPDARISIPRYMRIGHDAIQRCHNPALGLEMGLHMQASHFGKAGLLALTSADVRQACQVLTQYEVLSSYNSRGASSFRVSHGEGQLNFYSISPYNEFNLFVVDMALSSWYQLLIRLTGRKDLVAAVDIEFPEPDYADLYRRYFPCKVRFGAPSNTLVLHSGALDVPVVQHCASVHEKLGETEMARRASVEAHAAREFAQLNGGLEAVRWVSPEQMAEHGKGDTGLKQAARSTASQPIANRTRTSTR